MARLHEVDGLRAFALFGILAVNIWFFADPWTLSGEVSPDHESTSDLAVRFTAATLFEGKFYLLFAFLFGYSFVLQDRAADQAQQPITPRTLRRLAALALLGLAHGFLLFFGDILLTYAVVGVVVLSLRFISPRAAVLAAAGITAGTGLLFLLVGSVIAAANLQFGDESVGAPDLAALTAGPGTALAVNMETFLLIVPSVLLFQGPLALAMALLGMAAGRKGIFDRPLESLTLRRTAAVCLPLGLLAASTQSYLLTYADRDQFSVLATGITTLTAPVQTAGYVCLLLLAFRTSPGRVLLSWLAPAGRMALSNYLGQSVALAVLFTGYGFGLANSLAPAQVFGVVGALFAGQLIISRLWLTRFRVGPVEAVLRRVTYARQVD